MRNGMELCVRKPGPKSKKLRKVGEAVKVDFVRTTSDSYHDPASVSKVCLVCLRRYDDESIHILEEDNEETSSAERTYSGGKVNGEVGGNRLNLYLRFLQIMNRFLNIRTKRFRNSALQSDLPPPPPFCEECTGIVKKLCEAYEELQKVKLILTWRMSQILRSISRSNVKVSGKLGSSLLRNLSKQLGVMSAKGVDRLRKEFVLKCSAKVSSSPPKVTIEKISADSNSRLGDRLKVMEQFLKCLIIVFALATPQKDPTAGPKKSGKANSTGPGWEGRENGSRAEVGNSNPLVEVEVVPLKMEQDECEGGEAEFGDDSSLFKVEAVACSPEGGPGEDDQVWEPDNAGGNDNGSDSEWSPNAGSGVCVRKERRSLRRTRRRITRSRDSSYTSDGQEDDGSDERSAPSKFGKAENSPVPRTSRRMSKPTKDELTTTISCKLCECECVLSPKNLYLEHLLEKHEKADEVNHFCFNCDKNFTFPQTLHEHLKTSHPANLEIQCDVENCGERFSNAEAMLEHMKASHLPSSDKEVVEAVIVDLNYTIPKGKIDCSPDSEGRKLYLCGFCKWPFTSKAYLQVHMISHTPPIFKEKNFRFYCPPCHKKFRRVGQLVQHFDHVHGPNLNPKKERRKRGNSDDETGAGDNRKRTFKCFQCDREFSRYGTFYTHNRRIHPPKNEPVPLHQCDQCEEVKMSQPSLVLHKINVHGLITKFQCEVCKKYFINQSNLNKHAVSHEEAKLQCHLCPVRLRRPRDLRYHLKLHSGIMDYVCDFCGRRFAKSGDLTYHLNIHKGIKNHSCSFCEKKFCRKFARDQHERTHTGEKSFVCKYCGKAVASFRSLKTHEGTHERLNSDEPRRSSVGVGNPPSSEGAAIGQPISVSASDSDNVL